MKTALRRSVEGLLLLPAGYLEAEQVAEAAPVTLRAVRGYLRRLTSMQVLVKASATIYARGPKWQAWMMTEPKTEVGGSSRLYLAAKAQRTALAQREAKLIRAAQLRARVTQ